MRNVIGRENLITCGRTNELAHAVWTEYSCDSFMANRMRLDGTMLHYLAVRKAMVSVHKPVHSKITLTYSLSWQADHCTSRRMAFRALLNAKARPFPSLCSSFLCAYCLKKLPKRAPTKKQLRVLSIVGQLCACARRTICLRSIKSSLPFSLPLRHSCDKLFQALSRFSIRKAGQGLGTRLVGQVAQRKLIHMLTRNRKLTLCGLMFVCVKLSLAVRLHVNLAVYL